MRYTTSATATTSACWLLVCLSLLTTSVVVQADLYTICLPGDGAIDDPPRCDAQYDWVQTTLLPRCLAAGRFFSVAYVTPVLIDTPGPEETSDPPTEEPYYEPFMRRNRANRNRRTLFDLDVATSATDLDTIQQYLVELLQESYNSMEVDDEEEKEDEEEEGEFFIEPQVLEAAALDLQQRLMAYRDMSWEEEVQVIPLLNNNMNMNDFDSFEEDVVGHRNLGNNNCKNCLKEQCKRNPIPPACCILCSQFGCCSGSPRRRRLVEEDATAAAVHAQGQQRRLVYSDAQLQEMSQATMHEYLETVNNLCTYVMRMRGVQTDCFGDANGARCTSYFILSNE